MTTSMLHALRARAPARRGAARRLLLRAFALVLVLCGAFHLVGATSAATPDGSMLPCDRYGKQMPSDNGAPPTPCLAAHSTVRLLYSPYRSGMLPRQRRLYRVQRASDNLTRDIGLDGHGYANADAQDAFCVGTQCTITVLYDQSGHNNDLIVTPKIPKNPDGTPGNANFGAPDTGVPAEALRVTAGGHQVYGLSFSGKMGYHSPVGKVDVTMDISNADGTPKQVFAEGIYMVTSGTHTNGQCCFDYGNAEVTITDPNPGAGHMDAVFFGNRCEFAKVNPCQGSGPWVRADLENGLFGSSDGSDQNKNYTGDTEPYVTVMLKNDGTSRFTLQSGNARKGALILRSMGNEPTYNNALHPTDGYTKHKEGGIVLGTGGDDSDGSIGSFFEGVITQGSPSDSADADVQANIVSVAYGAPTGSVGLLEPDSEISLETSVPSNSMTYLLSAPQNAAVEGKTTYTNTTVATVTNSSSAATRASATWIVRRGLYDPSCLSFESKSNPGTFLRHVDTIVYNQPDDGRQVTLEDETFCPGTGLSGQGTTSFQVATPGFMSRYLGKFQGEGVTEQSASSGQPQDGQGTFKSDVSWFVVPPLVP